MSKQVSYRINGTTIPVSTDEVLRLPIPDYRIVTGLAPIKMVSEPDGPERQSCDARLPPTVEANARAKYPKRWRRDGYLPNAPRHAGRTGIRSRLGSARR
jgi:hypothetical protein